MPQSPLRTAHTSRTYVLARALISNRVDADLIKMLRSQYSLNTSGIGKVTGRSNWMYMSCPPTPPPPDQYQTTPSSRANFGQRGLGKVLRQITWHTSHNLVLNRTTGCHFKFPLTENGLRTLEVCEKSDPINVHCIHGANSRNFIVIFKRWKARLKCLIGYQL